MRGLDIDTPSSFGSIFIPTSMYLFIYTSILQGLSSRTIGENGKIVQKGIICAHNKKAWIFCCFLVFEKKVRHKCTRSQLPNFKTSYVYWYYIVVLLVNLSTTVFRRLSIHAHVGIKLWYFILATCATLQKIICQLFLIWNCSSSSPSVWWSGARKEILRNVNKISKEII